MNLHQLIANAEIIHALHVFESDQSFRSTDKDSERFREQFPDSKIASGYSVHADKTQYIIVYGIAPFVKEFIIHVQKAIFLRTNLMKRPHPKSKSTGISLILVIFLSTSLQRIVDLCLLDTVPAKTYYTISTLS